MNIAFRVDSSNLIGAGHLRRSLKLADALKRLRDHKISLTGASDHGVSEALYLDDPDKNGLELYWDKPQNIWPKDENKNLNMYTKPLDLRLLLDEVEKK